MEPRPVPAPTDRRDRGATIVEYALLIALISVVAVGALSMLGSSVSATFDEMAESVDMGATTGPPGPGPGGGGPGPGGDGPGGDGPGGGGDTTPPPTESTAQTSFDATGIWRSADQWSSGGSITVYDKNGDPLTGVHSTNVAVLVTVVNADGSVNHTISSNLYVDPATGTAQLHGTWNNAKVGNGPVITEVRYEVIGVASSGAPSQLWDGATPVVTVTPPPR